jgi:hypothetical protein
MKLLFRNQFAACNTALLHSSHLHHLRDILSSYKSFNPTITDHSESNYLNQAENLLAFIQNHSLRLSQVLSKFKNDGSKRHKH